MNTDKTDIVRGDLGDTANWLAVVVISLLLLGVVMVYSASAGPEVEPNWAQFWKYASLRQVVFVPVAVLAMLLGSRWPVRWWRIGRYWVSLSTVLLALALAALVLVLVPSIGVEVNKARRWLRLGAGGYGLGFQPSELAKIALVIFLAAYYSRAGVRARSFWRGFLPGAAVVGLVACLIAVEDFGTGALVAVVGVLMMAAGGVSWLWLSSLLGPAAAGFYFLVYRVPKRWERFTAFLDPEGSLSGAGYQALQSKIAIGSGGWRGLGLGRGVQKYGYLPEDTTDFIFAIIAEELGLIGCGLVIAAFIILLVLAGKIVARASSRLGGLMAFGLAMTIGLQAGIHIGVDIGVLPTKGISLPFVSAGGTGLVLMALAAGLIMSAGRSKWDEISNIKM
ncbi:MAG: FtsW/RodA/SpoVE family cell cycle protein [Phycisphaerae bacterium]|nr:FtsW/RodA/SpoVE family cell cycle protein [Phycisphaerae bacterium]